MTSTGFRPVIGNNVSDTLSSSIALGASSIPVNAISKWGTGIGKVIVDRGTSKEEVFLGTGISGSSITVDTNATTYKEGTSQIGHDAGASIESVPTAGDQNDLYNGLLVEHNATGTHKSALVTTLKATAAEVATGTDDTKIVTPLAAAPYGNSSMARQAIINGNFDVNQRAVTLTLADVTLGRMHDRWFDYIDKNGGTLPTLTRSLLALTPGELPNSFYCSRLTTNGAGTSLGVSSFHAFGEKIEHATRLLAGASKTVTLSFYARSSIAGKKIGVYLEQAYGSGGSPTAREDIAGNNFTLTSSFVKYTHTFTTNTLSGKTFGTANDDSLNLVFFYMWGTTTDALVGATTAETYGGSGTIDIAQVQLCAGDVALPFQPKSFNQELIDCERYCQSFIGITNGVLGYGNAASATAGYISIPLKRAMFGTVGVTLTASDWKAGRLGDALVDVTSLGMLANYQGNNNLILELGVASGLPAGESIVLVADGTTRTLLVTSEL